MKNYKHNEYYKKLVKCFYIDNKVNLTFSLLSSILLCVLNIITAFLFKGLADVATNGTIENLIKLILFSLLFLLLYVFVSMFKRKFLSKFIEKALVMYKKLVFSSVLSKDINAFNDETTSRYTSILTNDITSIESSFILGKIQIINNIFLLVIGLLAMLYLNWLLTICILISTIIPLVVVAFFSGKLSECEVQVSNKNEVYVGIMNSIFTGFPVIKSFKAEQQILANYEKNNKTLEMIKRKRRETANLINISSFSSSFLVTVVACGVGAYLSIIGQETIGTVIAFIQLLDYVVNPIQELGPSIANIKASSQLIEKVANAICENTSHQESKINYSSFNDKIVFDNVNFSYSDNKEVLRNINLIIEKGKSYAIVGLSGSGKTTILNMLLGYHDTYKGSIKLDSHEIKDVKSSCLYEIITVIQQSVYIFDDTIKENITMSKPFDDDLVNRAIENAGLSDLINEKGITYLCGENGKNLSGGEKQRIAIARALMNRSSVMLVDEATASLDNITSQKVINSILDLKDITRIVVTHKINNQDLSRFDKIIVMKNGEIVDVGEFNDLYEKKSYFYSLINVSE